MPLHINPALREREKATEAVGLTKTLNSQGYTVQLAQEAANIVPHTAYSAGEIFIFVGTAYAAL